MLASKYLFILNLDNIHAGKFLILTTITTKMQPAYDSPWPNDDDVTEVLTSESMATGNRVQKAIGLFILNFTL